MNTPSHGNADVVSLRTTFDEAPSNFFMVWLQFIQPLHGLSMRDMRLLAAVLYHRFLLSEVILDDELVDDRLFSKSVKKDISAMTGFSSNSLESTFSKFRKLNIFDGRTVNKKYLPSLERTGDYYRLILHFKIDRNEKK